MLDGWRLPGADGQGVSTPGYKPALLDWSELGGTAGVQLGEVTSCYCDLWQMNEGHHTVSEDTSSWHQRAGGLTPCRMCVAMGTSSLACEFPHLWNGESNSELTGLWWGQNSGCQSSVQCFPEGYCWPWGQAHPPMNSLLSLPETPRGPEDSWLWPQGTGLLWAPLTAGRHTHGRQGGSVSMSPLTSSSQGCWWDGATSLSLFCSEKGKRKKRKGGRKENWFSLTCGFFPLLPSLLWLGLPLFFKRCSGWWNIIFRHVELTADGHVVNTSPQIMWPGLVSGRFVYACVCTHTLEWF